MASLGLTLAREATIPIDLADEVRSLLDKNPREWAPSLLYETATGEKIKDCPVPLTVRKRARKKLLKGPANYPGPWND